MNKTDLTEVHVIIQLEKKHEKLRTYRRLIADWRLPEQIVVGTFIYKLNCGDVDDSCFLSYANSQKWPHKEVFMHYEEATLETCIAKAWRKLAEHKDWQPVKEYVGV